MCVIAVVSYPVGLLALFPLLNFQIVETVYLLPAWNENGWPGRNISRRVNVD